MKPSSRYLGKRLYKRAVRAHLVTAITIGNDFIDTETNRVKRRFRTPCPDLMTLMKLSKRKLSTNGYHNRFCRKGLTQEERKRILASPAAKCFKEKLSQHNGLLQKCEVYIYSECPAPEDEWKNIVSAYTEMGKKHENPPHLPKLLEALLNKDTISGSMRNKTYFKTHKIEDECLDELLRNEATKYVEQLRAIKGWEKKEFTHTQFINQFAQHLKTNCKQLQCPLPTMLGKEWKKNLEFVLREEWEKF